MPILSIVWGILGSRIGQLIIAFSIGWAWSWHKTDLAWEIKVAREKAAAQAVYDAEIAREKQAAIDIAKDATLRAEKDAELVKTLQEQIESFDRNERIIVKTQKGSCPPCVVDRGFADVLRKFDASPRR